MPSLIVVINEYGAVRNITENTIPKMHKLRATTRYIMDIGKKM
jgi:hypothetical protein